MATTNYNLNTGRAFAEKTVHEAPIRNIRDAKGKPLPKKKPRLYYDFSLLCALIFMFGIGLIVLYSGSQYLAARQYSDGEFYFHKQLFYGAIGLLGAIIMSLIDYKLLKGVVSKLFYALALALPIATLIVGLASHGKTRWLVIAGKSFQPAELVKTSMIIFLAGFVSEKGVRINEGRNIAVLLFLAALPAVLIGKENVSSGVILLMIAVAVLFVAVENYRVFAALIAAGGAAVLGLRPLIHYLILANQITARPDNYILRRIFGWAAPEIFAADAYQTQQAIYAIGSGGIVGQGLGNSIQKYGSIPEIWNDMIFSIVCEEFGFLGAAGIILIYLYIIYRIYNIAVNARDLFGTMLCTGVMAHLGLQVVLNIAVVTGVIPNTGVTLPFVSYGGSAILFTMFEMGIVLSVAHRIRN